MDTLTVGQLAALAGVSVEAVRFYEREGVLDEAARGASGYRMFPTAAVGRLRFVQRAQQLGFTLREIKKLLAVWLEHDLPHGAVCGAVDDKVADLDIDFREIDGRWQISHFRTQRLSQRLLDSAEECRA